MSTPAYQTFGFIEDESDFDMTEARTRLTGALHGANIRNSGAGHLNCTIDGWTLQVYLSAEPHVPVEAREIADEFSTCPRAADIAKCRRRLDIWSTDPDPGMDHFNDYLYVCEVLGTFSGVILFDPQAGELI